MLDEEDSDDCHGSGKNASDDSMDSEESGDEEENSDRESEDRQRNPSEDKATTGKKVVKRTKVADEDGIHSDVGTAAQGRRRASIKKRKVEESDDEEIKSEQGKATPADKHTPRKRSGYASADEASKPGETKEKPSVELKQRKQAVTGTKPAINPEKQAAKLPVSKAAPPNAATQPKPTMKAPIAEA